jgi:hypothetical protein
MKILLLLIISFSLTGCAGGSLHKRLDPQDLHIDDRGKSTIEADYDRFKKAEKAALQSKATKEDIRLYIEAGLTLSDGACRQWLYELEHTDRTLDLNKDLMNVVGNAIVGIAGLNGASAISLARASIVLSGANAAVDTYKANIIQGVIPEIRVKLNDGRDKFKKELYEDLPEQFDEAKRELREYHDTCSASEIRRLLNTGLQAIKYQDPAAQFKNDIEAATTDVNNAKAYNAIFGSNGSFSDEELFGLWVAITQPEDMQKNAPLDSIVSNETVKQAKEKYDSLKTSDSNKQMSVKSMVQKIGDLSGFSKELKKELAEHRKTVADDQKMLANQIKLNGQRSALAIAKNNLLVAAKKASQAGEAENKKPKDKDEALISAGKAGDTITGLPIPRDPRLILEAVTNLASENELYKATHAYLNTQTAMTETSTSTDRSSKKKPRKTSKKSREIVSKTKSSISN